MEEKTLTFKSPNELALFVRGHEIQMQPYYDPFKNLLAIVDLIPQSCCGSVKTEREESVEKTYKFLVMSIIRANVPIINKLKLASGASRLSFWLNGEMLFEG